MVIKLKVVKMMADIVYRMAEKLKQRNSCKQS